MPNDNGVFEYLFQFYPFCTPDWRWEQAKKYQGRELPLPTQDQPLIRLRSHLGSPGSLSSSDDDIARALMVRAAATDQKDELEARLLTGANFEIIAQKMALPVAVVRSYHDIFFDISSRRHATDWIALEAVRIGPECSAPPDESTIWRHMGWACPPALEILIADCRHTASAAEHELAEEIRLQLRILFTALSHPSYPGLCKAFAKQIAADPASPLRESLPHLCHVQLVSESLQKQRKKPQSQRPDASHGSASGSPRRRQKSSKHHVSKGVPK